MLFEFGNTSGTGGIGDLKSFVYVIETLGC